MSKMKICLDQDNANLNNAQSKLSQSEHGQHFTLVKCHICSLLNCKIEDIVEHQP